MTFRRPRMLMTKLKEKKSSDLKIRDCNALDKSSHYNKREDIKYTKKYHLNPQINKCYRTFPVVLHKAYIMLVHIYTC